MSDVLSLGAVVILVGVPVWLAVMIWRARPIEVPDEQRCAFCGRRWGHRLRCPTIR
jgi:hypothetical protein